MIPKPRYRWPDPKPLTSDDATGFATVTQGVKADSAVQSVVAGTNVTVDNTDPHNPVVSATGGGGGGATSARWWRLLIGAKNGTTSFVAVLEAEFRSSAGGSNLCVGGTAAASSQYDATYGAGVAFDGDTTKSSTPGDVWACANNATLPQWLGYQLPVAATVNEIKIWNRISSDQAAPRDLIVQSSVDSTNGTNGIWVDEWSVVDQTGWTSGEVRTFTRP